MLGLTSSISWRSIDMDALSAFISSQLAQGEHVYMKMPLDILQDTHCLSMNRCIHDLCESSRAFFMITRGVYINAGFTQLMSDKYLFVKIENNIIGGPASLADDDVINHGYFVSMSYLPLAQSLIDRYILLVRTVLQLSLSLCTLKILLYAIILTNSLKSLRLQLLRMLVFNCIVVGIFDDIYLLHMLLSETM